MTIYEDLDEYDFSNLEVKRWGIPHHTINTQFTDRFVKAFIERQRSKKIPFLWFFKRTVSLPLSKDEFVELLYDFNILKTKNIDWEGILKITSICIYSRICLLNRQENQEMPLDKFYIREVYGYGVKGYVLRINLNPTIS